MKRSDIIDIQPKKVIDMERSKALANLVGARKKRCFHNAILSLQHEPEDTLYVEGWVCDGLVFEHAWLESPEGIVIDPTLPIIGTVTTSRAYFSGFSYRKKDALRLFWEKAQEGDPTFPLLAKPGVHVIRNPAYASAMISAQVFGGIPKEWYLDHLSE